MTELDIMYNFLYDITIQDENLSSAQVQRELNRLEDMTDEEIIKYYKEVTDE